MLICFIVYSSPTLVSGLEIFMHMNCILTQLCWRKLGLPVIMEQCVYIWKRFYFRDHSFTVAWPVTETTYYLSAYEILNVSSWSSARSWKCSCFAEDCGA